MLADLFCVESSLLIHWWLILCLLIHSIDATLFDLLSGNSSLADLLVVDSLLVLICCGSFHVG